jgi:Fic family protein
VEIQARRRGRGTYYYLVSSYREGGKVRKAEHYLGKQVPANIDRLRAELENVVISSRYGAKLGSIRKEYRATRRHTPESALRRNLLAFSTRFTYDSNRIEGSTLTLRETGALLGDGITPSNRPLSDVQEAIAHEKVFLGAIKEHRPLDLAMILRWHSQLFEATKPELAGRIRTYPVRIGQSKFEPPLPFELDLLLAEFLDWYRAAHKSLHPAVLAGLVHFRLVSIHPFGDGNGRLTRIAMNRALYLAGYPMLNIAYTQRSSYHTALERSQMGKNESPFINWFLKRYLRENTKIVGY